MLTLYSNTLLSMSLPKVWVTLGRQEPLVHVFNGEGVLRPAIEASLSNKSGWEIKEVMVAKGDSVKTGQALVVYANREAENRYLDAQAQFMQQQLAIEELQDQYVEASRNSDEHLSRTVKRNLEGARITLEVQQRNLDSLKEALVSERELKAPFDGIVQKVNAVKGMASASVGPDIQLASSNQGYEMQLQIPASLSRLIGGGQTTDIQVQIADTTETMSGVIQLMDTTETMSRVMNQGENESQDKREGATNKRILINVNNEKLRGGEQASLLLSISSPNEGGILVPNKAIHREGSESYIFVVEEKKGALGNTSVARKVNVQTGDANEHETVVKGGIFPDSPIILESSEPILDGERIRVKTNKINS
ncbi:efflux RND transporter periplasmic adaptor subunit [Paenibacillus contaminans]|uniref:Efflux RND transporter periplasmic adaptor subunit n=1 Tax=Paenibacillus contaminans TaxID=450362 RepID=A0A329MN47_9BACL|nr:efflux RND transporter periplasmic adaptor subunit [Paenibacillus contaminans]RAV20716.1 efflux RND transporter periplasmic adaptor subunit [Paenibacillus contaminans]